MSWHQRMINHGTRYQKLYSKEISQTFSCRMNNSISIWILWYRCCSYHAIKAQQFLGSRKLQSVCQTESLKNWQQHGKQNWVTEVWSFLVVTQWTYSQHFKHESLLWSLIKHFCELFLEKIFNFCGLSGLDYFRKWTVTGHGIGDLEISINVHYSGVGAQVCNCWKGLRQCYSTTPQKTETQTDVWPSWNISVTEKLLFFDNDP